VDCSFLTGSSVLFDAVYIPGGGASVEALKQLDEAQEFVSEAFKHCKAIAANGTGVGFVAKTLGERFAETNTTGKLVVANQGVVTSRADVTASFAAEFIKAIAQHRHWEREDSKR
jgi:catalase